MSKKGINISAGKNCNMKNTFIILIQLKLQTKHAGNFIPLYFSRKFRNLRKKIKKLQTAYDSFETLLDSLQTWSLEVSFFYEISRLKVSFRSGGSSLRKFSNDSF